MTNPTPLTLGTLLITPQAEALLTPDEIDAALLRHRNGDHGNLSAEDQFQNRRARNNGGMVMSVFRTESGVEYWVQTHGSRRHTLVLLPGE